MIKPYWQSDNGEATIYCGDCIDVLPQLKGVGAVITDPPYGIFKKTGGDGKMFGKETIYSVDDSAASWDKKPKKQTLRLIRDFSKRSFD